MKKLLLFAGVFLALMTTVASNNKALASFPHFNCKAPIIVGN